MSDLFLSGDLSFAFFGLPFAVVAFIVFIDLGRFVAVFIAFMAVLGATAEQVGIFANARVLLPINYATSSLNPYGAKMFMDAPQHINI